MVVTILVPFWVPQYQRPKRDHNFDNHAYETCSGLFGAPGYPRDYRAALAISPRMTSVRSRTQQSPAMSRSSLRRTLVTYVSVPPSLSLSLYIYMLWIKTRVVAGPPPLLQTFVAGPLLQTLVANLCVEYCSLQGACCGGVCRRTPLSVTNLCREMAAQACYKASVFDSLPYDKNVYIYIYM